MSSIDVEKCMRAHLKNIDISHVDSLIILCQAYILLYMELEMEGVIIPDDIESHFRCELTDIEINSTDILSLANIIVSPILDS